jgi:hypothetical protein
VWETIRQVFLGSAYALSERYREAVVELEKVSFDPLPAGWRSEAIWTFHIALREVGREAAADSLLQALAKKPGKIGQAARELLQEREQN